MPVLPGAKGKVELNMHEVLRILAPRGTEQCMAVIEKVSAMPGQGVSSMFRFGEGYGALQMAIAGHRHTRHFVTPATWKKHFKLSRDKGVSRGLAIQRFPQHAKLFARVKDDGRAEATLLALYGQEILMKTEKA